MAMPRMRALSGSSSFPQRRFQLTTQNFPTISQLCFDICYDAVRTSAPTTGSGSGDEHKATNAEGGGSGCDRIQVPVAASRRLSEIAISVESLAVQAYDA